MKNLTADITDELWRAREKLALSKSDAAKIMQGTKVPCKTWEQYCEEATGHKQQVVNRWLRRWFYSKTLQKKL